MAFMPGLECWAIYSYRRLRLRVICFRSRDLKRVRDRSVPGGVMGLSTKAVNPKAKSQAK
eukprot:6025939-Pyramimonas_sp.AAC.1